MKLVVEIADAESENDEVWRHELPEDTPWAEIITAIAVLYPTAKSVYMYTEE